jgi:hypothetical protein
MGRPRIPRKQPSLLIQYNYYITKNLTELDDKLNTEIQIKNNNKKKKGGGTPVSHFMTSGLIRTRLLVG